jgi:hypothetical protein
VAKGKAGRPSSYREEYAPLAGRIALLGATDADLARILEVAESTIAKWKVDHPEFSESLKEGKEVADAEVAKSLYRRALGYSHDAVKIVADAKTGKSVQVPYVEHYPPDTVACIFWLKNRQPRLWRDKQEHDTLNVNLDTLSTDQLARLAAGEDIRSVLGPPGA